MLPYFEIYETDVCGVQVPIFVITTLAAIGVDVAALKPRGPGRLLCRPCLDWSERRPHLGGALGAALCARCFEQGWIKRIENTRAVSLTPKGRAGLHAALGVTL